MRCGGCVEVGPDGGKFRFDFQEPDKGLPQKLQMIEDRPDAYEVGREYEILAVDPAKAEAIEEMFASVGDKGDPVHGSKAWREEFLADYQNTVEPAPEKTYVEMAREVLARSQETDSVTPELREFLAKEIKEAVEKGLPPGCGPVEVKWPDAGEPSNVEIAREILAWEAEKAAEPPASETPRLDDIECRIANLECVAVRLDVLMERLGKLTAPVDAPLEEFPGEAGKASQPSDTERRIKEAFDKADEQLKAGDPKPESGERRFFGRVLKPGQRVGFTQFDPSDPKYPDGFRKSGLRFMHATGTPIHPGDWLVSIDDEVIDVIPRDKFQPFAGFEDAAGQKPPPPQAPESRLRTPGGF